jgi:hypothetical protein
MNRIFFITILSLCYIQILAQENTKIPFSIQAGVAPNYYFNNISTFRENVDPINYGFQGRILWNSKYRISLGLDVSPQKLYQVNDFPQDPSYYIDLWAIPIHFFIAMKINPKLYAYGGFGPSLLINNAKNSTSSIQSNSFSISDVQLGIGYKVYSYKKLDFSIEAKYFISTKNEDMNISFPLMVSYKL